MDKIDNNLLKVWFENGIAFIEFKKDTILDLQAITQTIEMTKNFLVEENEYILCDITNLKTVTTDARKYAAQQDYKYIYARAIIVNSHFTKFLFTSFVKFYKPDRPFAFFTDKEKAVKWLNELKAQRFAGHLK